MPTKRGYRLLLGVVVVLCSVALVDAHGTSAASNDCPDGHATDVPDQVPPRDGITVVTTDSNVWLADQGAGPRRSSEIVAYAPNGSRMYYDGTHDRYWDVDPSPIGAVTVLYAASDHLNSSDCGSGVACTRNVIERVNLTTGEVTRVYERITPYKHSTRWHDVDRLDDERLLVADIYRDRVFVVNATTGMVEWEWSALREYDPDSGGPFPRDWTHLNDVEVLDDGRFMVSLRNQDQVVFVDRQEGLDEAWTLGDDDDHDVLFEQHNPDYIPEERGGPAVVVADSENNRVVEYQRVDGEWTRSWNWSDAGLQWPRDADRLPNGNTLVTDSNGDRVLEVRPNGTVGWEIGIAFPYEAERLGTGPESASGESAAALELTSRAAGTEPQRTRADLVTQVWLVVKRAVPGPVLNGVVYLLPGWFGAQATASTLGLVGALLAWIGLEWRWLEYEIAFSRPIELEREER